METKLSYKKHKTKFVLEHIYMTSKVDSNRFEISNCFEKLFRLHAFFPAATFQTVSKFYCTSANDSF